MQLAFVHTSASMIPVFKSLADELLAGHSVFNMVDESLLSDIIRDGKCPPNTAKRLVGHVLAAEGAGAEMILVTCSSMGRAVEAAANELAVAQRARDRRQILAPIDGMVVDVRRRVGEWLEPGKFVVRLVRDDRLRATGFIKLEQLTAPLEGQPATLLVELSGAKATPFTGRVTFVSPEANPINRQVKLIAEFDNRDGRLRAGLPARMTVRYGN